MSGWHTQNFAASQGMTVKRYLISRIQLGWTNQQIANETGGKNKSSVCRLMKRLGINRKEFEPS